MKTIDQNQQINYTIIFSGGTAIATLLGPGGARSVVADSLLMKQQLLIIDRSRHRAPRLTAMDRFLLGFCSLFLMHRNIQRAAIIVRPAMLMKIRSLLQRRKYRLLYSSGSNAKPGPRDPSDELISAVVEEKRGNPSYGCLRIAQQIYLSFGIAIDNDIVHQFLAIHFPRNPGGGGPSWLTFLGHTKDSVWSVDLFLCKSILLKSHWVLVIRINSHIAS